MHRKPLTDISFETSNINLNSLSKHEDINPFITKSNVLRTPISKQDKVKVNRLTDQVVRKVNNEIKFTSTLPNQIVISAVDESNQSNITKSINSDKRNKRLSIDDVVEIIREQPLESIDVIVDSLVSSRLYPKEFKEYVKRLPDAIADSSVELIDEVHSFLMNETIDSIISDKCINIADDDTTNDPFTSNRTLNRTPTKREFDDTFSYRADLIDCDKSISNNTTVVLDEVNSRFYSIDDLKKVSDIVDRISPNYLCKYNDNLSTEIVSELMDEVKQLKQQIDKLTMTVNVKVIDEDYLRQINDSIETVKQDLNGLNDLKHRLVARAQTSVLKTRLADILSKRSTSSNIKIVTGTVSQIGSEPIGQIISNLVCQGVTERGKQQSDNLVVSGLHNHIVSDPDSLIISKSDGQIFSGLDSQIVSEPVMVVGEDSSEVDSKSTLCIFMNEVDDYKTRLPFHLLIKPVAVKIVSHKTISCNRAIDSRWNQSIDSSFTRNQLPDDPIVENEDNSDMINEEDNQSTQQIDKCIDSPLADTSDIRCNDLSMTLNKKPIRRKFNAKVTIADFFEDLSTRPAMAKNVMMRFVPIHKKRRTDKAVDRELVVKMENYIPTTVNQIIEQPDRAIDKITNTEDDDLIEFESTTSRPIKLNPQLDEQLDKQTLNNNNDLMDYLPSNIKSANSQKRTRRSDKQSTVDIKKDRKLDNQLVTNNHSTKRNRIQAKSANNSATQLINEVDKQIEDEMFCKVVESIDLKPSVKRRRQEKLINNSAIDDQIIDWNVEVKLDSKIDNKIYLKSVGKIDKHLDNNAMDSKLLDKISDIQICSKLHKKICRKVKQANVKKHKVDSKLDKKKTIKIDSNVDNKMHSKIVNKLDDVTYSEIDNKIGSKLFSQVDSTIDSNFDSYSMIVNIEDNKINSKLEKKTFSKTDFAISKTDSNANNTNSYSSHLNATQRPIDIDTNIDSKINNRSFTSATSYLTTPSTNNIRLNNLFNNTISAIKATINTQTNVQARDSTRSDAPHQHKVFQIPKLKKR